MAKRAEDRTRRGGKTGGNIYSSSKKMELKYVKEGRANCQNTGGFLFLPLSIVSGVLKGEESGEALESQGFHFTMKL